MPSKTYRPKSGNEGLQVEAAIERRVVGYDKDGVPQFDRDEGETFSVTSWPYTTENDAEQAYLDSLDVVTDQAAPAKKSGNGGAAGGGS